MGSCTKIARNMFYLHSVNNDGDEVEDVGHIPTNHGKVSKFNQSWGGQFAPQSGNGVISAIISKIQRGTGWSEETIRKREGFGEKAKEMTITEEILRDGHAVKTRADNVCVKCKRVTIAGEIVLGIVESHQGGSDRYYLCLDCVKEETENAE